MKEKNNYRIHGTVVNERDGQGVSDLKVEAWDKDLVFDDFVGSAITEKNGEFSLEFDSSYYKELCFDRKPDIYLKVYREQELIHSTEDSVLWNVANPDIQITISVALPSPVVTEDYSFYMDNNWFTRKGITLEDLTKEEHEYIARQLNRHLRSEILKSIGPGKPGLKKLFSTIVIDYRQVKDSNLNTVIKEKLLLEARKNQGLEEEIEEMEKTLDAVTPVSINSLLYLELPLRENPVVAKDYRKAKAFEFAKIIDLDNDLAVKLAEKDLDLDNANEAVLNQLVEENILDEQQKKDLRLTIDLSRLSGENIGLIKVLKNDQLESMADFVLWDRPDWANAIEDNKITLPEGEENIESYAENLRLNIEKTFPTQYLLKRVIKDQFNSEINLLNSMETLMEQNDTIIDGTTINYQMLDWTGIGDSDKQQIEKDLAQLLTLANTYRQLGLADIVNDNNLNTQQKKTSISLRLANLDIFYKDNPKLDLNQVDFLDKETNLNWTGIEESERAPVKKQMMAFQRTLILTENYEANRKLLGTGLDSALEIANMTESEFFETSDLGLEEGRNVYLEAQENTIATSHLFETIRDSQFGLFKDIDLSNQSPLVNDLRQIDGFEELFGSQDYCDCEHCKSILGPAAYFVDLMYFVHKYVSKKTFIPLMTTHPLYLKSRRPDLWTLKLTCQNTTAEIPYLEVVNGVLEQFIEKDLDINDVYNMLWQSNLAITLPFNLPLAELRLYLSHFELKLYDVYNILDEAPAKQLREKLEISAQELAIITTPDTGLAKTIFGNIALADFNVRDFIRLARISRDELDDLLNIGFLPEVVKVKVKTIKISDDIQQYKEVLQNLTGARLDLIHRFVRFWKKTGWTIREFDLVLCAFKSATLLNNLEEKDAGGNSKILQVSQLVIIREALNLSVEEACAMVGDLPRLPIEDNQESFYERLFDQEGIFGVASSDAGGNKIYNTKATLLADKTQDKITSLLLAGLGITESELDALFVLFQLDTASDLEFDIQLLSELFRHARIAKGLKLSIEDLTNAIQLGLSGAAVSQLSHIHDLIEFISWLKSSPFTVPELTMILQGRESSSLKYRHDANSVAAAVLEIQKTDKYDKKTAAEKIALLESYLQRTFNLTAEQLEDEFLAKLVSTNINGPRIAAALNAGLTDDEPDNLADFAELVTLVREIEGLVLLFDNLRFEAESITYFINNPDVFGIADLKDLILNDLKNAVFYKSLVETNKEMESKIGDMLKHYQYSGNFSAADIEVLSDLWRQPRGQVQSITNSLNFVATALPAVKFLWQALQLCQKLGIEGHSLIKLKSVGYPELQTARDIAVGAFSSRYDDEKNRQEKLEPYIDKMHTLKRDALCDYVIARRDRFKFNDRDDLYKFFLLDVEMSGCFRTSKLVAAISSVQLYIHRCLINLEQSDKYLNPDIVDIQVIPTKELIKEWRWRKNYRVWEVNRKVFLYPENYIDPTMRDNKTNIFKQLEDELLQEKITEESAEAAYKKYLSQFAELTKLKYAGAYYHSVPTDFFFTSFSDHEGDTNNQTYFLTSGAYFNFESRDSIYYLFARTNVQPYQYYYRSYNHYKNVWGNWEKIELGIEAEEISSLVHRGKLYIYWTEVKCKEINKIKGGDSTAGGAIFKVYVKYSFLDENGKWSVPQRLYIGYTHFGEEKIYNRVMEGYPGEDERDKKHDYIFEQFERKMFRKPYARINNDIKVPIKLSYIWSQNYGDQVVKYITDPTPLIEFEFSETHWPVTSSETISMSFPSVEFIVTNNQFDHITEITDSHDGEEWQATFYLIGPGSCFVRISATYTPWVLPQTKTKLIYVPVTAQTVPSDIYASTFDQSLSANRIINISESDIKDNDKIITHSSISFLKKEFNMAYTETGDFSHYVEDGTKNFTNNIRVITQYQSGDGHLLIPQTIGPYDHVALTTILTDESSDILFAKGLEQFLSLQTQQMTDRYGQQFDLKGSYGQYYWEMFFHIPFLIANHLNANHKYKEAKWWYERIFNPTAAEKPGDQKPSDHNWQFREFRNLDIQKLKDILINADAIEAYKKDPFNPHAIARLRLSAYQKAIVMKYIDNLIDWGDHLFGQDTRESINEAQMLYQLAADILGNRPVKMGKCKTAGEDDLTYEEIGPRIGKDKGSEFLITLENYYLNTKNEYLFDIKPVEMSKSLAAELGNAGLTEKTDSFAAAAKAAAITRMSDYAILSPQEAGEVTSTETALSGKPPMAYRLYHYADIVQMKKTDVDRYEVWTDALQFEDNLTYRPTIRFPGVEMVKENIMAFCVPSNADLLKYWDRVEDRLFKIRHCMNISGVRRSLALFQPPIDPMMLVRARASGLSLEDITALLAGLDQIPPYRFNYLVEKTRQFTQTVQSFGNALLSALEKKDVEELTLLRSVHERNILKMTKSIKKKQLQEAQFQYMAMEEILTNVQNRIDYYQGLVDDGLTGWETTQQISKHTATQFEIAASVQKLLGAIFFLIPQVGSPFAMKYGGLELGNSAQAFGELLRSSAAIANSISASAGLEATFQRREQEWKHQLKLAEQEYKQVEKQKLAAEIRGLIAEKDLEIHEESMEQADELNDFYKNKFTNLGLYNYLSSTLNRLYREAYNLAYNMAKMAERAYHFEQDDDTIFIANDNWQFDRAGLLAGESLMLQLQKMEHAYIESNVRRPEITQSFSLALLDPSQLLNLRQTGTCTITIPEIAFELFYPGQYKRLVKSVRLSIPCVVGPYANVSAKLTLLKGEVESEDEASLTEVLVGKNSSISTSSANSDAGMFEFNFRDERYLPFEGSGAISQWRLELPSTIRSFNYDTISDVIMHISYTARDGNRETAETALVTTVTDYAAANGLSRLFSLKHEFPNGYHKLLNPSAEAAQETEFTVEKNHFPYFLIDQDLTIGQVKIYLKPKKGLSISTPVPGPMNINGKAITWDTGDDIPISEEGGEIDTMKGGTAALSGSPINTWSINAGFDGLNRDNLDDILILVKYNIS